MQKIKLLLRYRLHEKHTLEELKQMILEEKDQKKMMEIAQAITLHLIDIKKSDGSFVSSDGYSGRQTNRR